MASHSTKTNSQFKGSPLPLELPGLSICEEILPIKQDCSVLKAGLCHFWSLSVRSATHSSLDSEWCPCMLCQFAAWESNPHHLQLYCKWLPNTNDVIYDFLVYMHRTKGTLRPILLPVVSCPAGVKAVASNFHLAEIGCRSTVRQAGSPGPVQGGRMTRLRDRGQGQDAQLTPRALGSSPMHLQIGVHASMLPV